MNINEFLIRHYKLSQEESVIFLQERQVLINKKKAIQRQKLDKRDELIIDHEVVRAKKKFSYYAYYKPKGIECTLNRNIKNNLYDVLSFKEYVYPIGRLDKDSEGLLILTNDGRFYKDIALADRFKEKEYEVTVNHALNEESLRQLSEGLMIKGKMTRPAQVRLLNDFSFNIILTQGINRQIRRMCYKLGYQVIVLKRIRIADVSLEKLQPGEFTEIEPLP